jgi:hypothetical protein
MRSERVAVVGTVSFWMNVFTDTPQVSGCCLQSINNVQNSTLNYVIPYGYSTDAESADYSMLWMKAHAVHAIALGGPQTREQYKAFHFPDRFQGRLSLLWQQGDDYIYRVPARASGLARVVRRGDLVVHPPANGIDVQELRRFVEALDNSGLPVVQTMWEGTNQATISGTLEPGHVISVAVNHDSGWQAHVNERVVPVRGDGLGLLVVEPGCSGRCEIVVRWSPGWEPVIAISLALTALVGGLLWIRREKKFGTWSA